MNDRVSVRELAEQWGVSERTIRNYCASGKIAGAILVGKTWVIPSDVVRPQRQSNDKLPTGLLDRLRLEKRTGVHGGIYHKIQIDLTYNSNHIEGSKLTHEQTRLIFETRTIGTYDGSALPVDDIIETANHFRCIDAVIDNANRPLTEGFIKRLHSILKSGTSDSRKEWFAVGAYKKYSNAVGDTPTTAPEDVEASMVKLLAGYSAKGRLTIDDLIAFHHDFEAIHPFQDGNGRVGRLILFKECLRTGIVPFVITDDIKHFYYRGLREWKHERGYLRDTCLLAQDNFKNTLDYFGIDYEKPSNGLSTNVSKSSTLETRFDTDHNQPQDVLRAYSGRIEDAVAIRNERTAQERLSDAEAIAEQSEELDPDDGSPSWGGRSF